MVLNKQKGNMYGFVTHTWNPVRGRCPYGCTYCYMISFWDIAKSKCQILDEKTLNDDLGKGNFIFVGSSTDMFADEVSRDWIKKVLKQCRKFDNTYLFQTKNPMNLWVFLSELPKKTIVCTTAETNRRGLISKAPKVKERLDMIQNNTHPVMVTIEPIMDFDLDIFTEMIKQANPKWVNIGADSKGHHLQEPSFEKLHMLISNLEKFTEVRLKPNLNRLLNSQKKPNKN